MTQSIDNKTIIPQFKANLILRGQIECITGLHIGGSKDRLEIGGVDSPVIRDPRTRFPYIPGSSLKGKMRTLLEYHRGKVGQDGKPSEDEEITRIFGLGADDKETGPTRLIVRDCKPDEKTKTNWKKLDSELLFTEYKAENTINRLTSEANPRFIERVVAGSFFDLEMIYTIYEIDKKDTHEQINKDLVNLMASLRMLQHNFLGKSGSRGYGKIRFHFYEPIILRADDYEQGSDAYKKAFSDPEGELLPLDNMPQPIYS